MRKTMNRRISFLLVMVMLFAVLAMPANAVEIKDGKAIVTDLEVDAALLLPGNTATVMCMDVAMVSAVEISASSVAKIADQGKSLTVVTAFATIEVNNAALSQIAAQGGGKVVTLAIEMNPADKLNGVQQAAMEHAGVMLVLNVDVLRGEEKIYFEEGSAVIVKLPEMLVEGMGADKMDVALMRENGKMDVVATKIVDGYLVAELNELGLYVLMPKAVNPFEDVADDAWYAKPVLWAVEASITFTSGLSMSETASIAAASGRQRNAISHELRACFLAAVSFLKSSLKVMISISSLDERRSKILKPVVPSLPSIKILVLFINMYLES